MAKPHEPKWQTYQPFRHLINPSNKDWLLNEGSLTQKLKAFSKNFSVRIISTHWQKPKISEAKLLKIPSFHFAFIREVELICDDQICVIARTVIPRKTLQRQNTQLLHLGTQSLGEYIFNHPQQQRLPFEFTKAALSFTFSKQNVCQDAKKYWGRRSVFLLNHQPLLVTEFFTDYLIR